MVGADQGQGFLRVHLFDQVQTLHCFLAEYATAQTINGVGGIDDHPILVQDGNHLFDQTRLGIVGIDTGKLRICIEPGSLKKHRFKAVGLLRFFKSFKH